jgi:hypothetical protein
MKERGRVETLLELDAQRLAARFIPLVFAQPALVLSVIPCMTNHATMVLRAQGHAALLRRGEGATDV